MKTRKSYDAQGTRMPDTILPYTIGDIFAELEKFPRNYQLVVGIDDYTVPLDSAIYGYRGIHDELAFFSGEGETTVGDFLETIEEVIDSKFHSYGNDYYPNGSTMIHYAQQGDTSNYMVIDIFENEDNNIVLLVQE